MQIKHLAKYAHLITALEAGKTIQRDTAVAAFSDPVWVDMTEDDSFDWAPLRYHIKPEPEPGPVDLHADLKAAAKAGKVIQFKESIAGDWRDGTMSLPFCWCYPPAHYRIKPEPKFRPYTDDEIPVGALARWKDNASTRATITGLGRAGEALIPGFKGEAVAYSACSLLKNWEISVDMGRTWVQAGVEVKE